MTASPPDVIQPPLVGPVILQDLVQPPTNAPLLALPEAGFVVPVRVSDPNQPITCKVFVDFDPGMDDSAFAKGPAHECSPTWPSLADGGDTVLSFSLLASTLGDPTACHLIQCFVADSFALNASHVPGDVLGGTSVWWQYAPNGLGGCSTFDAGDGAFPPADAPTDTLPVPLDGAVVGH